ncbi:hypothetical protein ACH5RR_022302 [Cinchona calisaya]|uniref:SCP domain-containing protein n=1 Tax=Cinchona calisaya TaxID=153742 RepID=A0ABD2ZAT5_9GENT
MRIKQSDKDYGETLAKGYGNFTGIISTDLWVAEKSYYNYQNNGGDCLHYTLVVWRDWIRLACASVQCLCAGVWRWEISTTVSSSLMPVSLCGRALFLVLPTQAQNSPQDYLNVHNSARSQVGVGPMTCNTTVAAYAQNYANQRISDCNLIHSNGPYGENLAAGSGNFTGICGLMRNVTMIIVTTLASADSVCITPKLCGVIRSASDVLGFNALILGGSSFVAMILQATILDSVLTRTFLCRFVRPSF